MTRISYVKYMDMHILECSGHSGFGAAGNDILCSAISVLCLTAREYLQEQLSLSEISRLDCRIEPGLAVIKFTCKENSDAEKSMDVILCGFRMLSESFPDNIELDI